AAGYDFEPVYKEPETPGAECAEFVDSTDVAQYGRLTNQAVAAFNPSNRLASEGWRTMQMPSPPTQCVSSNRIFVQVAAVDGATDITAPVQIQAPAFLPLWAAGELPVTRIIGVYDNAEGSGTNYGPEAAYNATTGVVTLATALPTPLVTAGAAWVYFEYLYPAFFDPLDPTVDLEVGAYRISETVDIDPEGDGSTFYTRAAPVSAVSAVFDETGAEYTATVSNSLLGRISVVGVPPSAQKLKVIYYVGPVTISGPNGDFQGLDYSLGVDGLTSVEPGAIYTQSIPFVAGYKEGAMNGATFVADGSAGLNLMDDPRGVPGVWHTQTPGQDPIVSDHSFSATFIKETPYVADKTSPSFGRFDTDTKTATFAPPHTYGTGIGDPTKIQKLGPIDQEFVKITVPSNIDTLVAGTLIDVLGVWDNADLTGANYFTGGSFNATTSIITLGTLLPSASQPVWVAYAYSTGHDRWGVGTTILDELWSLGGQVGGSGPISMDPLIVEQYTRDQQNAYIAYDDQRQFVPFNNSGQPDDGNSSNTIAMRIRYYNYANIAPQPWLPFAYGFAGELTYKHPGELVEGAPGVLAFVKFDGATDFKPYGMMLENPSSYDFTASQGFIAKFEPNSGIAQWQTSAGRVGEPYWTEPNNYIAMPVGMHQYYFATCDDKLGTRDNVLLLNPLADTSVDDPKPISDGWDVPTPPSTIITTGTGTELPQFWLQPHPPTYQPGTPDYGEYTGNLGNTYAYADITALQPGVGLEDYPIPATSHPVVHGLLSGLPFGPLIVRTQADSTGGYEFLGTLSPYTRYVNPVYYYPVTGPDQTKYPNVVGPASQLIESSGGTTTTVFTFRTIFQSFNPVTKVGRAPQYVRVFINSTSNASGAYTSHQMTPTRQAANGQWVTFTPTAANYKAGVTYAYSASLPVGPHTYYFEADAGFGPIRFPVRPDGRVIEKPASVGGDATAASWGVDEWVPGVAPYATDNDYCPGPYVNSPPVLSAWSVTPSSGPLGTEFVYQVTYRDADNQRPSSAKLIIESRSGVELSVDMSRVDPVPMPTGYLPPYATAVVYNYRLSSAQASALAIGDRRYRFEFRDDWGRRTSPNDIIPGELVKYPASTPNVTAWVTGPNVSELVRPTLSNGSVTSSDGTSDPNTTWTYQVTYSQQNEVAPSYVNVYIGSQRNVGDPLNVITLQRIKPSSSSKLRVYSVPILSVTGVYTTSSGTGVNYYTGGSFNANTGEITLGTALADSGRDVWVTYSANPIEWEGGRQMVKRDAADTLYSDGAVYSLQTQLTGSQNQGDLPISYYFSFQASDGQFVTRYDAANSPSAFALTRQPTGELSSDSGEILNNATSIGNQIYTLAHYPLVGPLPDGAVLNPGVLGEPKVYRNGDELIREFSGTLSSAVIADNVTVNPSGLFLTVNPNVVHAVLSVSAGGTEYYNTGEQGKYNASTGVIGLGQAIAAGVRPVTVEYYNRGDYRLDFNNGKLIFTQANSSSDVIEVEYWWSSLGPEQVGGNKPPALSLGKFTPDNPGSQVDGSSTTPFTFSVVYTDTDGTNGNAPSFVRVVIDGQPLLMTTTAGATPIYRNGVTFTRTTTLSSGSHLYYFETSDGTGFAVFDQSGGRSSAGVIGNIVPLAGPVVNDNPVLSGGSVSPTLPGGIAAGTPVTYRVNYSDADGNGPNTGYPRVWIDNLSSTEVSGKISSLGGSIITVSGASYVPNALAGRFLQITTGLVPDPDTGLVGLNPNAGGKTYYVQDNGVSTITLGVSNVDAEGIVSGDTFLIGSLIMHKENPAQTDFKQSISYVITVPSMTIGNHQYHYTVTAPPTNTLIRLPISGEFTGPLVSSTPPTGNSAPILSSGSVTPKTGRSVDVFSFQVTYLDADGDPPGAHDNVVGYVKIVFDDSSIPSRLLAPADGSLVSAVDWSLPVLMKVNITGLPAGTHKYHFEASDGYRSATTATRFPASSSLDDSFTINGAPVLSTGTGQGVSPVNGSTSTVFTWSVTYTDPDNDAGVVKVEIDGTAYTMTKDQLDSNYADGMVYTYSSTLGLGNHSYRFTATGGGQTATPTQVFTGPVVQNIVAPVLSEGTVSPTSGSSSQGFTYSVKYKDLSNTAPTTIAVIIDNDNTPRSLVRDLTYGTAGVDSTGRMLFSSSPISVGAGSHT
ncbi:MAG: hypothetical protein WCL39_03865, partial [Armatimonadota bacterium]